MKFSLRYKMIAANGMVFTLLLLVISIAVVQGIEALNRKMLIGNMVHQADTSVITIKQRLLSGKGSEVSEEEFYASSQELAARLSQDVGLEVRIFSNGQELLAHSGGVEPLDWDFHELGEVARGNRTYVIRKEEGIRHMYFSFPVLFSGKAVGAVMLAYPMDEIDKSTQNVKTLLLMAFIGGTLLMGVVITLLSFRITKPIEKLTQSAMSMADGDFTRKIGIQSSDEIGGLARAFNTMSSEIENRINIINIEKSKLNSVLESMGEGVIALDSRNGIIASNKKASALLGIPMEPNLGLAIASADGATGWLVDSCQKEGVKEQLKALAQKARAKKTREVMEIDFEERNLLVSATPLTLENGEEGAVFVLNDMTELRQLQEKQRQFVTNVSHELKTPLTTILGYVELLKTKGEDKSIFDMSVGHLEDSSERLLRLINDLIDLSALSKFEFEVEPKSTDISKLVQDIAGQMALKAQKFNICIHCEVEKGIEILVDPLRMKQALVNVLDNAIKYSTGGEVRVRAYMGMQGTGIEVEDNGCGIPEDVLDKIFEPFYRVDKARSRTMGGNGLGLSITREIIEKHGGSIQIDSKPNKGTKVSIFLPHTF